MVPETDERLHTLGTIIRDARRARHLTQQRIAKEAGISRAQLTILESGGNVSVKFLLRLARALDLTVAVAGVPLDSRVTAHTTAAVDVMQLLRVADLLGALVEDLRNLAVEASLPESERGRLNDTLALKEFVSRHVANDRDLQRLGEMLLGARPENASAGDAATRPTSRMKRRTP